MKDDQRSATAIIEAGLDLPEFERSLVVERLLAILDAGDEIEVLEAALRLPTAERWRVVNQLLATLENSDFDTELHPSWSAEIERRVADIDNPEVKWLTWEEVQAKVFGYQVDSTRGRGQDGGGING